MVASILLLTVINLTILSTVHASSTSTSSLLATRTRTYHRHPIVEQPKAILTSSTNTASPLSSLHEIETLKSLGMSSSEIESLLGGGLEGRNGIETRTTLHRAGAYVDTYTDDNDDVNIIKLNNEYDEYDEIELYDDDDDGDNHGMLFDENSKGDINNESLFSVFDGNDQDDGNDTVDRDNEDWWKDPFANFDNNVEKSKDEQGDVDDDDEEEEDDDEESITEAENLFEDVDENDEKGADLKNFITDEEDTIEDLDLDESEELGATDDDDDDDDDTIENIFQEFDSNEDDENKNVNIQSNRNDINNGDLPTLIENEDEDVLVVGDVKEGDEYYDEYYDYEDDPYFDNEQNTGSTATASVATSDENNNADNNIMTKGTLSKQSKTASNKPKSLPTLAIPAVIIPKLTKHMSIIKSPLTVPVFAAITLGNIALHRIGVMLNNNKNKDERGLTSGSNDDELLNDNYYDADELAFSDDDGDYVETVGYGRPIQSNDSVQYDDYEEECHFDSKSAKKRKFGVWGIRRKKNKPDVVKQDSSKENETDSITQSIKKKRRLANLFHFNKKQMEMQKEMEAQLLEIELLRERSTQAEQARERIESDYDEVLQHLKDAQKKLVGVSRTNTNLKNELRDSKNVLERAIHEERQKTNSELARVRDEMVAVLERERRIMRAQLMKSSEEVRSMIERRDYPEKDYDDEDDGNYDDYD